MYPWIPWELVADPLGSVEHALETTGVLAILKDLDQFYSNAKMLGWYEINHKHSLSVSYSFSSSLILVSHEISWKMIIVNGAYRRTGRDAVMVFVEVAVAAFCVCMLRVATKAGDTVPDNLLQDLNYVSPFACTKHFCQ